MAPTPDCPILMIATPCAGGLVTQTYMGSVLTLMEHAARAPFRIVLHMIGRDSLITRARNELLADFLSLTPATHLFFVDADIGFEPAAVERLLHFDQDVVAGMYPLRAYDPATAELRRGLGVETPEEAALSYVGVPCSGAEAEMRDGFVTGQYAGTGFLMIKRAALERMVQAYPETRYRIAHTLAQQPRRDKPRYALFDCMIDPETGAYLSEDFTFCRRWRQIGGQIWLDTQTPLVHVGPHDFRGNPGRRFHWPVQGLGAA